jgi:2-polyprenyl-3-methyl-5-hydroxy-6-metoxy-1,4-benzoquinol methylase
MPDSSTQLHSDLAADWNEKYKKSSTFQKRLSDFLQQVPLDLKGQSWLDAGCGTGTLGRVLAQRGAQVWFADNCAEMLDECREINKQAGVSAEVLLGNAEAIELPGGSFDGIICSSVIEYVDDPDAVLERFRLLLKPGGRLVISAANKLSVVRFVQRTTYMLAKWPRYMGSSKNSYTRRAFGRALRSHAFIVKSSIATGLANSLWLFSAQADKS